VGSSHQAGGVGFSEERDGRRYRLSKDKMGKENRFLRKAWGQIVKDHLRRAPHGEEDQESNNGGSGNGTRL